MSMIFDGIVIMHFRIEDISCYYLSSHFHKTFKKKRKNSDCHVYFLKDSQTNEMIIYCAQCKFHLKGLFFYLTDLIKDILLELKKLIQHFLPIK